MSEDTSGDPATHGRSRLAPVAGPLLLWGLGVGYVISGDYYGWNFGLPAAGYRGFLLAIVLMAILYALLAGVIAELAAAIPHSGGALAFTGAAFGPFGGYVCGAAVLVEYITAGAAIGIATGAYLNILVPAIPIWAGMLVLYLVFTGVHLLGASTSLKAELVLAGVALVMLVLFAVVAAPAASLERLDGSGWLPNGWSGVWAALPAAAWFFLAIEGLPMAAEESKNARRDLPIALCTSLVTLLVLALITPTISAGLGGIRPVGAADAPLPEAARIGLGVRHWMVTAISLAGLTGLLASFHAILFSCSRLTFALARQGYLPAMLANLNRRHAPNRALLACALAGAALAGATYVSGAAAIPLLVTVGVFQAAVSYMLMTASFIRLRRTQPDLPRPFRVPGGTLTAAAAFLLSALLSVAGIWLYPWALGLSLLVLAVFALRFRFLGRIVPEALG